MVPQQLKTEVHLIGNCGLTTLARTFLLGGREARAVVCGRGAGRGGQDGREISSCLGCVCTSRVSKAGFPATSLEAAESQASLANPALPVALQTCVFSPACTCETRPGGALLTGSCWMLGSVCVSAGVGMERTAHHDASVAHAPCAGCQVLHANGRIASSHAAKQVLGRRGPGAQEGCEPWRS